MILAFAMFTWNNPKATNHVFDLDLKSSETAASVTYYQDIFPLRFNFMMSCLKI